MTWGKSKTKYRTPDRRKWHGKEWFLKSKYGIWTVFFGVAVVIWLVQMI